MVGHAMSCQSFDQLWDFALGLATGQSRNLVRRSLPFEQGEKHKLSGDTKYIAKHTGNPDVKGAAGGRARKTAGELMHLFRHNAVGKI